MTAKGALASDALTTALINLVPRGIRPRCSDPETHYMWLSEDEAERKQAARWCAGCPVLAECDTAARANRERFGVWGGVDLACAPGRTAI
jgi:hypothetical protein